jgi:hypothetical protein
MKKIQIEDDFVCCGYRCLVVVNAMCVRCGYVGVPKSHPAYGVNYNDMQDIDCHGGLTFDGEIKCISAEPDDLWYFGFDCAHGFDKRAVDEAVKYGLIDEESGLVKMLRNYNSERETSECFPFVDCDFDYVKINCIKIAGQLRKLEQGK